MHLVAAKRGANLFFIRKVEKQEKAEVAVATDPETRTVNPTVLAHLTHSKRDPKAKEKAKVAHRRANPNLTIIPQANANQRNHAAIAVVQTTPHAPATCYKNWLTFNFVQRFG